MSAEDKLVLVRLSAERQNSGTCVVRITNECYAQIMTLNKETGISFTQLSSMLMQFALDHVELVDAKEPRR